MAMRRAIKRQVSSTLNRMILATLRTDHLSLEMVSKSPAMKTPTSRKCLVSTRLLDKSTLVNVDENRCATTYLA